MAGHYGHGPWVLSESNNTKVRWKCSACDFVVEFVKPGLGSEPTATEDSYPPEIDAYTGQMCGQPLPALEPLEEIQV
jgi:hypothetical protein